MTAAVALDEPWNGGDRRTEDARVRDLGSDFNLTLLQATNTVEPISLGK